MSLYVPTGTPPLIASAMARIERRLPHPGDVLVRAGQRVEPEEAIARAYLPGTPQVVNLARALMIAPALVERAMIREVGNKVAQGAYIKFGFAGYTLGSLNGNAMFWQKNF